MEGIFGVLTRHDKEIKSHPIFDPYRAVKKRPLRGAWVSLRNSQVEEKLGQIKHFLKHAVSGALLMHGHVW